DSEARAYYEAHKSDYRIPAAVTLSHIQVKSEAEAKRILQWARNGQDWKKLAARYSTDSLTRESGGALGSVTRDGQFGSLGRQPALAESAFGIGEGKVGGPFHTDRGWHVLRVESVRAESTRPFEQMMGGIVRQLSAKGSQDYYQSKLAQTKAALGVKPDSNAIKNFVSQKKSAREMFNEAQSAGPPTARIDAYQRLLDNYPSSDVSPQAQFMIGFIHSEELKDYDQAEKAFRAMIDKYPKSELVRSAKWMLEHMRSEGAPGFMNLAGDSIHDGVAGSPSKPAPGRPPSSKPTSGKP
ncbi:MAG: tetratricopeptide repeat protein, partial [Candidatus Eisenbacteria bacterium]